jgi:carboxyl-terminal processing protease
MRIPAAPFRRLFVAALLAAAAAAGASAQDKPPAPPRDLPLAAIRNFSDVMLRIKDDSAKAVDDDELMVAATRAMLEHADPEGGEYYTKAEFDDFKSGISRRGAEPGVELRVRQGQLVLFPVAGGPAAAAGVRRGDVLRSIDGVALSGLELHAITRRLWGEAGSKVALGIARPDSAALTTVLVVRADMPYPPVSVTRIDGDLAVVRVPPFQVHTLQQVADALGAEWARKPFKGLLIDLRHNSGGLLESSIGLAAMFLQPQDIVVSTSGRIRQANQVYRAAPADYLRHGDADPLKDLPAAFRTLPLVVLVDESTASGAEISAAALRDHERAILVGHITYGRGSIQTIMPLASGAAMKLTTAYYTTPSGRQLNGSGLQPDVAVAGDDEAQALQAAVAALRKRL